MQNRSSGLIKKFTPSIVHTKVSHVRQAWHSWDNMKVKMKLKQRGTSFNQWKMARRECGMITQQEVRRGRAGSSHTDSQHPSSHRHCPTGSVLGASCLYKYVGPFTYREHHMLPTNCAKTHDRQCTISIWQKFYCSGLSKTLIKRMREKSFF